MNIQNRLQLEVVFSFQTSRLKRYGLIFNDTSACLADYFFSSSQPYLPPIRQNGYFFFDKKNQVNG
jgi:hypothetical protein